jgi:phospholipase C
MPTDRRTFLQLLTSGAAAAAFPSSIARALAIPANNRKGTIEDVEHIVFMMQENRSFDHYFGTLRGVRGYGDPRAVKLPSGDPVWQQPSGSSYVLPFHPPAPSLGLQFLEDLAHDWTTTHEAWNVGKYDQWVPSKGAVTMAHLTRSDIPFHYAPRWRMRSRYVMRTTARCWGRPIRTATTCGRAGWATMAREAVR